MAASTTASDLAPLADFARFADVLGEAMLLVAADGEVLCASSRMARLVGSTGEALRGRPLASLVADAPAGVEALLRTWSRTGQSLPGKLEFQHGDGRTSVCRCDGGLFRRAGEAELRALILVRVVPRDAPGNQFIALSRQVDELSSEVRRRRLAESELHAQREWLRVTLAGIGDAVIATDIEARVTFMNPAATLLTGWSERDALHLPLGQVFNIVNEETRAPAENPIERVLREGVVCGLANHTVLIRRDGSELAIDDSGAPIRDSNGDIIGAVLVFHDMTERRALERELREKARALEELNRKKDEFLAMLSHELRNPLAPLRNCIAVLERAQAGDTNGASLLAIMARQVSHLTRLVDDLLDVSRITSGRIRIVPQPLALEAVLHRAAESVQGLGESRQHEMVLALEPAMVRGDEARLAQVFINLLENAIKYTPPGGTIRLSCEVQDACAVAVVEDTGIGIDAAMLPTIFDLFTQSERSLDRAQGGLGVGLALVRMLVGLHGGTVVAESAGKGQGSRFTVRLPLVQQDAIAPESDIDRSPSTTSARRILVVDDNDDIAHTLALVLGCWGHEARTAADAAAALAACEAERPDVAILDIGLPGTDGYELASELRRRYGELVLIALTGYGMTQDRERAKAAGFDHHLTKPADLAQLRNALTAARPPRR